MQLSELLQSTFGFPAFRANQEAVCRATTEGRDVLLVMPTGAGKSLCYQLPAIARGGTALVVSPLIALMDDQANKLQAAGLRVARIHSGLSREDSRQACRDYLDGKLQFLFIAPERMRVPGFPEMLARRKPSLIAIDEAHCISAWGHDFRPDYRTLGDFLPALRPAPVIALTATATPTVQQDIAAQLHLDQPALFIHGFRRDNLAIEVVELSKPRRTEFTRDFLSDATRRPAIVYAPSRKAAEELAGELGRRFPAAAYHAGLEPSVRERVQRHFLSGKLEVVVATIAFGMGIDKADVRTVVHFALPASVEAYYQEIGRAGRDGLQSRTVLLHSYADRKMHDFFMERDYPITSELTRIAKLLTDEFQMPDLLRQRLKMDSETFDKSVEKLAAQGAAVTDLAGNVRRSGNSSWQSGYERQVEFRRTQIDRMVSFAETQQCRMTALIRHFGDLADAHKPCGRCDFCAPDATTAQTFAEPTASEEKHLRAILRDLDGTSRSTGKLFTELALTKDRKAFDCLLDGLARAGLITLATDSFTASDGKVIAYRKASLTHEGKTLGESESLGVVLQSVSGDAFTSPPKARTDRKDRKDRKDRSVRRSAPAHDEAPLSPQGKELEAKLRAWRREEAAKTGKPAFMIFGDRALAALAASSPRTLPELMQVSGFGPDKCDRYGAEICAICRGEWDPSTAAAQPSPTERKPRLQRRAAGKIHAESFTPRVAPDDSPHEPSSLRTKPAEPRRERPQQVRAAAELSSEQAAVEQRLRDWRKAESTRMGLPQFFVLGTSTLRNIVVAQPGTLSELRQIDGIGPDKLERFGPAILEAMRG